MTWLNVTGKIDGVNLEDLLSLALLKSGQQQVVSGALVVTGAVHFANTLTLDIVNSRSFTAHLGDVSAQFFAFLFLYPGRASVVDHCRFLAYKMPPWLYSIQVSYQYLHMESDRVLHLGQVLYFGTGHIAILAVKPNLIWVCWEHLLLFNLVIKKLTEVMMKNGIKEV